MTGQARPIAAPAASDAADLAAFGLGEGFCQSDRHGAYYLEAGPPDGPPIMFIHGWPELSWSWRRQLRALGDLGFRAIAPDVRGCGRSSLYKDPSAYRQREVVADMVALADALGVQKAVWVGHDWGSATVWNLATHHPDRCHAVANLCVAYRTLERGLKTVAPLINRQIYPEGQFPFGQFEYMRYYVEAFEQATATFEADVEATFAALMRRPDPAMAGQPFPTAYVRQHSGWFGGLGRAPAVPRDDSLLTPRDHAAYVEAYRRTGFHGTDALYLNDEDNRRFSDEAAASTRLGMPVLFLSGLYDFVCDTERSDLMAPMIAACGDLTIETIACGHWMQQEAPEAVNAALAAWIACRVPGAWPRAVARDTVARPSGH